MRRAVLSIALLQALVVSGPVARAHYNSAPLPPGPIYGVGCYWFRGQHYCNRYCYLEVDGYEYCQRRLEDAGSQAPPPAAAVPPYGYTPRAPFTPRPYGPPPRRAPRP